jgi:cytoskeleton protein RodZ
LPLAATVNRSVVLHDRRARYEERADAAASIEGAGEPEILPYDRLTGAARVGADLRMARERLGWTTPQVAGGLRIRLEYIEALEGGRIAALPGMAYAVGFVRTYSAALGLDAQDMARRLKADAPGAARKPELTFPAPVPERGVPAGAVVLLSVVLAVGAYVGWYRLSGEGALPAETVPPVPERLAPLAAQVVPPSIVKPAPPVATLDAPAGLEPAVPGRPFSPGQAVAAMPPPPDPAVAPLPSPAPAAPANPDDPRIVIRAKGDAWIQVRDKAGPIVLNRTLHAGDTWPVPNKANLLLTTGNAGGTELLVDGTLALPIGAAGSVKRDIPLDPQTIKDGKLAAQSPAAQLPPVYHAPPPSTPPATPPAAAPN